MMQNSKQSNRKLRKLGVGAASMMIGLTMLGVASSNNEAHADAGQSTIPVAAKPTATATANNSTATNTSSNTNANSGATTHQTSNQPIKTVPAVTSADSNLTKEQAQLSAETPAIDNNASYDATATQPSVVDEQIAHGVYVSTADASERTAFSNDKNTTQSEQAVINPIKTDELTAHGVITNNSNQTKHVEAVYFLPLDSAHESKSEVYQDVTLDSSRFDPSKGVTVNGGNNVQVSYSLGAGDYNSVNQLPSDFDWSKVIYIMLHADLPCR